MKDAMDAQIVGNYLMKEPCRYCGCLYGEIRPKGFQDCLYCKQCNRFLKNEPRTDSGNQKRKVNSNRSDIKASQKMRIIQRDGRVCQVCSVVIPISDELQIGHLLSVKDGTGLGWSVDDLNSDLNLVVMCAECNLGLGSQSVSPRLYIDLMRLQYVREGKQWNRS